MKKEKDDSENGATALEDDANFVVVGELLGKAAVAGLQAATWPAKLLPDSIEDRVMWPARKALQISTQLSQAVLDAVGSFAAGPEALRQAHEISQPGVHTTRNRNKKSAIVFVHGFGQNSGNTWGEFDDFLVSTPGLDEWDIFRLGYATNLRLDIVGLWEASPPVSKLGQFVGTAAKISPLDRYQSLAFVAHSMGGLVTQQALIANEDLRSRTSHFVCYGTPSDGLKKANLLKKLNQQVRDMAAGSEFITKLRRDWKDEIGDQPPFKFMAVAGDTDEFVPASSSIKPFPESQVAVIPGNHVEVVNAQKLSDPEVQLAIKFIQGDAAPAGPWNSARVAIESRNFQRAIDELEPHKAELDEDNLIFLALALDSVGRREDAMKVLEEAKKATTDMLGTLAGRIKRRWLVEGRKDDAVRAEELYADALKTAESADDPDQVYYLAINAAFMKLASGKDQAGARELAEKALAACARDREGATGPENYWRLATEGEANLYLGRNEDALSKYRKALERNPKPWQISSTYFQAVAVTDRLDDEDTAEKLRVLFREYSPKQPEEDKD